MGWFNDTFGFDIPGLSGPGSITDVFFSSTTFNPNASSFPFTSKKFCPT